MAGDPYFSTGSSGGGDPYFGGGKTSKKSKPPHKAHGVGGFFENLGHDVVESAYGIPAGIKASVEHPLRTGKQFAKAESATWSPLFHGHFGEFAHNTYHRPLTPLLDIATVATLPFGIGEGLAGSRIARLALAPGERGLDYSQVIAKNPIMRASQRMGDAYRPGELRGVRTLADEGKLRKIESNPEDLPLSMDRLEFERSGKLPRRFVSAQLDKLLKKLPADFPLVGELKRYARLAQKLDRRDARKLGLRIGEFEAATKKLKGDEEKAAFHFHGTAVDPERYAKLLEDRAAGKAVSKHDAELADQLEEALKDTGGKGTRVDRIVNLIRSPEFRSAYENAARNPRLMHALKVGRRFSEDLTNMKLRAYQYAHDVGVEEETKYAEQQITKLGDNPAPEKVAVIEKKRDEKIAALGDSLAKSQKVLEERPFLHMRLLEGARFDRSIAPTAGIRQAQTDVERLKKRVDQLNTLEATKAKSFDRSDWVTTTEALQEAQDRLDRLTQRHANKLTGGNLNEYAKRSANKEDQLIDTDTSTVEALRKQLQAEGKPEPFYIPDISEQTMESGRIPNLGRRGGGLGPQDKIRDAMRQNHGILFLSGALSLNPETLALRYRQYVRDTLLESIHEQLLENAVALDRLPKGWTYIRETSLQRLPKTDVLNEDLEGPIRPIKRAEDIKARRGESNLAVPDNLVRELAGEFTRSNNFIRALFEKPTTVWRAIVLNLRVGYLTNNVLGQMFLLHYHYFGPSMLEAWAAFIKEQMPAMWPRFQRTVMRKNIELPERPFRQTIMEYAPSQIYGTQFRSQVPGMDITEQETRRGSREVELAKRGSRGVAGMSARLSEDVPRDIAMRTSIIRAAKRKGIWEHRVIYDPEKFDQLAHEIIEDPHFADRAVAESNSALGDYLSMNSFERGIIRQIVPFYGWLRAITKITLNSAIDTPGRTLLMAGLGKIGAEIVNEQLAAGIGQPRLPQYLLYLLPLGKHHVLSTKGANPWATLPDVLSGAVGLIHGKPGDTGRAIAPDINPFVKAFVENLSGKNLITGKDVKSRGGLLGGVLWQNFRELPPTRAISAAVGHPEVSAEPSKYFGQTNALREVGSYLGVPLRGRPHPPAKNKRKKKVSDPYFG